MKDSKSMTKQDIVQVIKNELTVIAECSVFHGQFESTTVITESAIDRIADIIISKLYEKQP